MTCSSDSRIFGSRESQLGKGTLSGAHSLWALESSCYVAFRPGGASDIMKTTTWKRAFRHFAGAAGRCACRGVPTCCLWLWPGCSATGIVLPAAVPGQREVPFLRSQLPSQRGSDFRETKPRLLE